MKFLLSKTYHGRLFIISILFGMNLTSYSQKLDTVNNFFFGGTLGSIISKATQTNDPNLQQILNSSKYNADVKLKMYYFWNRHHGFNLSIGFLGGSSYKLESNISDVHRGKQVVYPQNYSNNATSFDVALGYNYRGPIFRKFDVILGANAGILLEDFIDQYWFRVIDSNTISEEFYYYQLLNRKSPSFKLGIDASANYTIEKILIIQLGLGLLYWHSNFQYSSFKQDNLLNQYEDTHDFNYTNLFPKISLGLFLNVTNLVKL